MEKRELTGEIIGRFRKHLMEEEKSEATVEKYIRDVSAFFSYIKANNVAAAIGDLFFDPSDFCCKSSLNSRE